MEEFLLFVFLKKKTMLIVGVYYIQYTLYSTDKNLQYKETIAPI